MYFKGGKQNKTENQGKEDSGINSVASPLHLWNAFEFPMLGHFLDSGAFKSHQALQSRHSHFSPITKTHFSREQDHVCQAAHSAQGWQVLVHCEPYYSTHKLFLGLTR